jgi:hypothetical protein
MRPSGFADSYAGLGVSIGIFLAIFRRFWAVAARMHSFHEPDWGDTFNQK